MKFCNECGSRMKVSGMNYFCPRCGTHIKTEKQPTKIIENQYAESKHLYILDDQAKDILKVSRTCPRCGKSEAIRWLSTFSGEHSGVDQERTVEHYRCAKCQHTWAESR